MLRIYIFLKKVKSHPALYLGKKDITALSQALAGYEEAIFDLTGERVQFNSKFQQFAEYKFKTESTITVHWTKILSHNRREDEAFDLFFELLDEFFERYEDSKS